MLHFLKGSFGNQLITIPEIYRDSYINYQKKRAQQVDDERMSFEISTVLARKVILQYIVYLLFASI